MSSKKISKNDIMSISMDRDTQDRLKNAAKKRNITASKLIRDLVEKNLSSTDEEVDTVILKVPSAVKTSEEDLRKWLAPRVENIVKILTEPK